MGKGVDFISMHNISIDSYLGQYGLFYDYFYKPTLVYRKVSPNNWAFYSLLQEGKRAKSYKLMEPYLNKFERKYKYKRQRDQYVDKLGYILSKVENPYNETRKISNMLSDLSSASFTDDLEIDETFSDFKDYQVEKFRYNLLKYFFFANNGFINRLEGVYTLKDYARFMKHRMHFSNNRVYNPQDLTHFFYLRDKNLEADYPMVFFWGYSFYRREKMYGLDSYFFQNPFIRHDYNEDDFFRF
jgi:hypothetical protein